MGVYIITTLLLTSLLLQASDLTLDEKIGQIFMVAAVSDEELNKEFMADKTMAPYIMDKEYIARLIKEYHVGGVVFLGRGTIQKQIERTAYFQFLSKIPLLIGQDLEPGLVSRRVIDGINVAYASELGKLEDQEVYAQAQLIAEQAHKLGVHIIFAPVVDVNTNPVNPVIGRRAFGDNKELVAQKGIAFMRGLQDAGIIACAKHFPGHGDTSTDSHETLPTIAHDYARITDIELYPFKKLIKSGVQAVMIAHLAVPALEEKSNLPTSLSEAVTTKLLKKKLGFSGLVVTDGLGMKALTDFFSPGQVAVQAIKAGAHILLCPVDVPESVQAIKEALAEGTITEEQLDKVVTKIMRFKKNDIKIIF